MNITRPAPYQNSKIVHFKSKLIDSQSLTSCYARTVTLFRRTTPVSRARERQRVVVNKLQPCNHDYQHTSHLITISLSLFKYLCLSIQFIRVHLSHQQQIHICNTPPGNSLHIFLSDSYVQLLFLRGYVLFRLTLLRVCLIVNSHNYPRGSDVIHHLHFLHFMSLCFSAFRLHRVSN